MRLLLDEDVPQPLLFLLKHLLRGHAVEHVSSLGWKGRRTPRFSVMPKAASMRS